MSKAIAMIVLLVALGIPVWGQSVEFLSNMMKAIVEEYGIETVLGVLENLGYIGEGEVAVSEVASTSTELTVNHAIWDLPDDERVDVLIALMSDSGDEMCWNYVNLGTSDIFSASQRMGYRASFMQDCLNQ